MRRENAVSHPLTRHAREGGHPVRRGFSAQALRPLEYWIARSSRATTGERVVQKLFRLSSLRTGTDNHRELSLKLDGAIAVPDNSRGYG